LAATLEGRDFTDLNGDGTRQAGEAYSNDVTVQLFNGNGVLLAAQTTHDLNRDADPAIDPETERGWYSFPNLAPGPYVVHAVSSAGFRQTSPTFVTELTIVLPSGPWDYSDVDGNGIPGPANWASVAPEIAGDFQSPVNLTGPTVDLSTILEVQYSPAVTEKVFNNGHTIEAVYTASPANQVTLGGEEFELEQLHFHIPSEHTLDGQSTDMELHLVNQHANGGLAVLGVRLVEDPDPAALDNPAFAPVFDLLKQNLLQNKDDQVMQATPIDASAMLPADRTGYFYEGSLTTPPGTSGVNWFVFTTPVVISKAQVDAYRAAANDTDPANDFSPGNRPIQPLNGRQFNQLNYEVSVAANTTTVTGLDFALFEPAVLSIAATNATQPEGNSGNQSFTFTVTRAGDTSGASTVDYAVAGSGTYEADATDFGGTLPSGTVSFSAGDPSKTITILVSGDTSVESDEGFVVTLSNSTGATIGTAADDGVILDDDVAPQLAISATNAVRFEGDNGNTSFTFTVTRTGDTSGLSSATYAVTGIGASAADGTDFGGTLPNGTVNFATGHTSQVITINVSGDTTVEFNESFGVTLSNPVGTTLAVATADGTIQNDEAQGNPGTFTPSSLIEPYRPVWIYGHNPNTIYEAQTNVDRGANAIEPDVEWKNGAFLVAHRTDSPLPLSIGFDGTTPWIEYLDGLVGVAQSNNNRLALVEIDVKDGVFAADAALPAGSKRLAQQLIDDINEHLLSKVPDLFILIDAADEKQGQR
jgi:carbonic anhydrase